MRIRPSIGLLVIGLSLAGPAGAQGRKQPAKKPKPEQKSTSVHDVKEGTNDALNDFDHGIHKAGGEVKDGANKALQAVDDTIHGRK